MTTYETPVPVTPGPTGERTDRPGREATARPLPVGGDHAGGTAFVLGGGGQLGAAEVGMLRALCEAGVRPDLILGASVGALNGALLAADPGPDSVDRLERVWTELGARGVFSTGSVLGRLQTITRSWTHVYPIDPLRELVEENLPVRSFEELPVTFGCVAACIERAAEHWFTSGPLVDAVLASCAVPGLFAPVAVDGEHFLDGGLVNSIPVDQAVALGARRIFVLHVGRVDRPLTVPTKPWEVATVAFEIARRHRYRRGMSELPDGVVAHVLPTGVEPPRAGDLSYRDFRRTRERIDRAHEATLAYLDEHLSSGGDGADG